MKKYIIHVLLYIVILSSSSSAQENAVTITYLQNDGVMISNGEDKVLIDALFSPLQGWINISIAELNKMISAEAPYDDIDLVLITHNHGDHYSISSVNSHLNNNPNAKLIAPPQVRSNFSGSQVINVSPPHGESQTITANGIEVEVLHMTHFDAFGNDFSSIQNFGYLVKISGINILHLGDVEMSVENLQSFGLAEKNIDYVLIPTFNTQAHLQTSHRDALLSEVDPANIIGLHLFASGAESTKQQVLNLYPNATVFTEPMQSVSISLTGVEKDDRIFNNFTLYQNYPNPFNPTTEISFKLKSQSIVSLEIFNIVGQKVRTLIPSTPKSAGVHNTTWNGMDDSGNIMPSGTYIYTLQSGEFKQSRKLIFLK